MGTRRWLSVAVLSAALAAASGCADAGGSSATDGSSADGVEPAGEGGLPTSIASADEVIKVVDQGFATEHETAPGYDSHHLSYGYVVENVSDAVAVTVRVAASFTDAAGRPIDEASGGDEFTVILPGQRMGSGGREDYQGEAAAEMTVEVTLIASLDTLDGARHRQPPGPYAELTTSEPATEPSGRADEVAMTFEVTNTYDVAVKPWISAVVRDPDGTIVSGTKGKSVDQRIQPGDSAPVTFTKNVEEPDDAATTVEYYADPELGRVLTRKPVWQVLG